MCGIVAVGAKTTFMGMDVACFEELLVLDSVRGIDGTGVVAVRKTGNADICKIGSHTYDLLGSELWKKIKTRGHEKYLALLGHNRKATFGSVSNENSHPFRHEGIVVVHNGCVDDYKSFNPDAVVDSSVLPKLFHTYRDNPAEALSQLKGAFSLLWYDAHNKLIRWVRNKERPLFYADTLQVWGLASEAWMLGVAGPRNANMWSQTIEEVPVDTMFTWDITSKKLTDEKIKWKTTSVSPSFAGFYGDWGDDVESDIPTQVETKKEVREETKLEDKEGQLLRPGDSISFSPKRLVSWSRDKGTPAERKGWRIEGEFGDKPIHRVNFSLSGSDAEELMRKFYKSDTLTGKVYQAVSDPDPRYGKYVYWVEKVEESPAKKYYRTLNGVQLTLAELVSIKNKYKCSKCHEPVKISLWGRISVKKDNNNKITRVFCKECVDKRIQELPAETQAKILQQNLGAPN
jgi:RNase P subunit RPR2